MKDLLDRDIMVGDTLALASGDELKLFKVVAKADFAIQLQRPNEVHFIVSTDSSKMVICDWAKGSDAA